MNTSSLIACSLAAAVLVYGQDLSRQIWDTGFLQKRPTTQSAGAVAKSKPAIAYQTSAPTEQQKQSSQAAIGVTLWRLRRPSAHDTGARLLLQEQPSGSKPVEFVPERISLSEPLHEGDRVRLSIESPQSGFLYVIDRERYSDGSAGDPVLIYPSKNFHSGTNDVEPGCVIEIPPQDSKIPALSVTTTGERHVGEELLIVVTKELIPDLQVEEKETKLARKVVANWERTWGVTSMRLDMSSNEHGAWTQSEKAAGENRRLLTQDDPMPATIFSVAPSGDKPLLVRIPLEIKKQ